MKCYTYVGIRGAASGGWGRPPGTGGAAPPGREGNGGAGRPDCGGGGAPRAPPPPPPTPPPTPPPAPPLFKLPLLLPREPTYHRNSYKNRYIQMGDLIVKVKNIKKKKNILLT